MYPAIYRDLHGKHVLAERDENSRYADENSRYADEDGMISYGYMCGPDDTEYRVSQAEFEGSRFTFVAPFCSGLFDPSVNKRLSKLEEQLEKCYAQDCTEKREIQKSISDLLR